MTSREAPPDLSLTLKGPPRFFSADAMHRCIGRRGLIAEAQRQRKTIACRHARQLSDLVEAKLVHHTLHD